MGRGEHRNKFELGYTKVLRPQGRRELVVTERNTIHFMVGVKVFLWVCGQ